jgi:hypothetical protein
VRVTDGVAIGEVANVCIAVWRGPVTRPRFDAQRDGLEEVLRRHRDGAAFLCVIEPTSRPPTDDLRRASADLIKRHESALSCIACVVEGTGFMNAVARSALSAMALLVGPRRAPLAVMGTVTAAATWMAPRTSARDAGALARSVESLRGEMAPWTDGSI